MQEGYVNEQQLKVANYESYIENWVHEIKKPLSLMTLLLDNRKVEMSPLVHPRSGVFHLRAYAGTVHILYPKMEYSL